MSRDEALLCKIDELKRVGFAIIPRELVGLQPDEIAAAHAAQLCELDRRFEGWRYAAPPEMEKALAGGFLGVQLLPEQLSLEFDPRIEQLYRCLFASLRGSDSYNGCVWVWLERSNVSLAEPTRERIKQQGALPHIDHNPWSDLDVDSAYDHAKWEPKVRMAGLHDLRPMEKDRPVQAFIALTDCVGGADGGGMGMSTDRGFFEYLKTTPPHGRNGHWGRLTRIYPSPGGAKLKALPRAELDEICSAHQRALDAIVYPSYRAGDVVVWLRETLHAGPKGNSSGVHAARLYLGGLPDNALNRDAVRRQWEKLLAGQQAHWRARDRAESAAHINALLTAEQQRRAGSEFAQKPTAPESGATDAAPADAELFAVPGDAVGLGFKNATACVRLRAPLDGLPDLGADARVFVKIGESAADAAFAAACAQLRGALGLATTPACVVWVRPTIDWAALADCANPKWGDGVRKRLRKALEASERPGALPAFVGGVFNGVLLSHAAESCDGFELLRVLLFRKYVGSADTNGRNLLVGAGGAILSVDETAADAAQLARGAAKGLQTAQPFHGDVVAAARAALLERPAEVAATLRALRLLKLPAVVTEGGRLAAVHAAEPFSDTTLDILDTADATALARLATRLGLGAAGKKRKAMA